MHQFANNLGYTGFVTGDWDFALEVMGAVLAEDIDSATRTWLLSNWLIIRVSRGDEVERELAQLKELAATHTDPHIAAAPLDTLQMLHWPPEGTRTLSATGWHRVESRPLRRNRSTRRHGLPCGRMISTPSGEILSRSMRPDFTGPWSRPDG